MKTLKVALAAACAVVVGWAFTASADIPASAYVQDGLVAQWDGIENAGLGQPHDPTAAYPQELVSGIEQTLTGTMAAGDNYFTLGAGYTTFKLPAMFAAINAGHATVEMYAGRDGSVAMVNNAGFVALGKSSRAFWAYQYSNYFIIASSFHAKASGEYQSLNFNDAGENTVSFLMGDSTATSEWRVNGVSKGTLDRKATDASENDDCYIGYIPGFDKARARMYSLRFYNRKLTAAEAAFNANIDKVRFADANPATLTWPDGYRWNAETEKIEFRLRVAAGGEHGTVTVDGATPAEDYEGWSEQGSVHALTATPAEGFRFVCWNGDGLTDEQRTSAELSLTLGNARSLSAVFMSKEVIPASAYVQSGLVIQYDGIENAGEGLHADAPASWVNLKGTSSPMTLSGDYAWNGNGVDFNRTATDGIGNFTVPAMPSATGRTVETAARPEGGNSSPRLFGENALPCLYLNSNRIGMWCNGGLDGAVCERSVFDPIGHFSTYGVSVDISTKYTVAHFDGARYTAKTTTCSPTYSTALNATFANRPAKGAGTVGMFYALRVYDRVLTDDEVAMNAALDRLRFDGADPEDVGYRWNAEAEELEYRVVVRAIDGGTLTIGGQQGVVAVTNWVTCGESFDVHAIAVPAEGSQFVIWRGKSVPDAQRTTAEIQCTVTSADDIAAKFIADGAVYWTFNEADNTITHNASGQVLKAERAIGGLTLAGFSTTPGVAEVNLLDPIYSPDFGEDLPIVAIKDSAFQDNLVLERFIMPDTVLTIGQHAFNGCDNLGYIRMSANAVSIGYRAFYGKQGGISRYFDPEPVPPSVTKLDGNAFAFSWLTNDLVRLCNPALTTIGSEAFSRVSPCVFDMRGLVVTTLGNPVYGDSRLVDLYLPATLQRSVDTSYNWCGQCGALRRIYFSGPPISFATTDRDPLAQSGATYASWYVPKWNKDWEAYLADPNRCLLAEMTAAGCKTFVTGHPGEPLPTLQMQMSSDASPQRWVGEKITMGVCFWYPDPPPTYEPVTYFDILGWSKRQPTVDAANATLFDGTVWTACNEHGAFVWTGDGTPVVYELGADCTAARGLKFTGYRLHQACITKDNKNVQLMPNGRAPTAWTLEGRTKGGEWVTLDTQTMTAASEKHWAYFDYGEYSETVPARTSCSLEYAIAAEKQDCYTAFRFTPTASHNSEAGTDATPYSLMEIEFIGLVTTAEPVIGAFEVEESAWSSIDFTVTVSGFGDDNVRDLHATSAKAWVELSETDDFSAPVAAGEKVDAALGTAQTLTVGGLDGNHAYYARVVVSNDLGLAVCKTLEGTVSTLSSPFALGGLTAGTDEDGKLTVDFAIDKLYADSVTVTLFYAAQVGGAYGQVKSMTVTAAGPVDFGTLDVEPLPTSTVKVEVRVGDNVESREASVFAVWTVDAAGGVLRHSKSGATFNMTLTGDAIALGTAVSLGDAPAFDFTIPIVDANGAYRLTALSGTFADAREITEVILPDTVTAIGDKTFYFCMKLAKVRLPNALESIGESAFYGCSELSDVVPCLPATCTSIGKSAFYNCGLTEVVLSDAMTTLPDSAFSGSTKLKTVTLPANITTIDGSAFYGCSALKTVLPRFLPASLTSLGVSAFRDAPVESDELYLTNPNMTSVGSSAFNGTHVRRVDLSALPFTSLAENFVYMPLVEEYVLPKGITAFTGRSFSGLGGNNRGIKIEFRGGVPILNFTGNQGLFYNSTAKFLFTAERSNEDWQKYIVDNLDREDPEDGKVYVRAPTAAELTTFRKCFPHERLPQYMIALHPFAMMNGGNDSTSYAYFRWKSAGFMILVR